MGLGLGGICKPGGSSEAELVGSSVVLPQTPPPHCRPLTAHCWGPWFCPSLDSEPLEGMPGLVPKVSLGPTQGVLGWVKV